jgi:predicted DCC family thiol-disulfide oxidoreductase YuxK
MGAVVLFDGVCNLCSGSVKFILKRDRDGYFSFASLQSVTGQQLLKKYGLPSDLNSFVLIENEKAYVKSSAALKVCWHLKGMWRILSIFRIIPPFIRNVFYDILAKNRYNWFGKTESCMLPSQEWKNRFLE